MDSIVYDMSSQSETDPNIFIKKDWVTILDNQNGQGNHEFLAPKSTQPLLAIVQGTSGAQNIHLILGE